MPRHELRQFAQLALHIARQQVPPYGSTFSPKKFTQPSLWACLCLKEYLRLDYRGLEALTARRYWQQVKQAFLRGVTYNLYRAVQLSCAWWRLTLHRALMAFAT